MNDREAFALLEQMVSIPSPSGEEQEIAGFLVRALAEHGFRGKVDEAGNFIGEIGTGPVHVVLLGHIDTVPGEIPVRIENGWLFGRGSVDAKGPLAAFLAAASRVARRDPRCMRLTVIGCVEEEVPSSAGARHVVPLYRPDACVVGEPSGWNRVTLGYKGYLGCRLRCVVPGAHPASWQPTAAEQAVQLWNRVQAEVDGFNLNRNGSFEQLLPTLASLTTTTDGCHGSAELFLSLRLPVDLSPERAEAWIRERIGDHDLRIEGSVPAFHGGRTGPLHTAFARALLRAGQRPRQVVKTGTADLNIVAPAWGCPALAYGPGDSSLDHAPDERIELDEFKKGIGILEEALRELGRILENPASRRPASREAAG